MGTVALLDPKLTGTTNRVRLALIVRVLSIYPERNTPAQRAKLAAAKRLLGGK